MNRIARIIFICSFFITPLNAADIAVVVSADNMNTLSRQDIKKIFLGKIKQFPNGNKALAYDLPAGDAARKVFIEKILNRSESRLNAYWARMLFSSKATPPEVKDSVPAIKKVLAENPNAIAYIPVTAVDASMKVILTSKTAL